MCGPCCRLSLAVIVLGIGCHVGVADVVVAEQGLRLSFVVVAVLIVRCCARCEVWWLRDVVVVEECGGGQRVW